MAVEYIFNGKIITIPGSYATTKAKVNNQPLDLSYGNVLVIDKDGSNSFGGGSSIKGELKEGVDAVYSFDNLDDFRTFVRGGDLYDLALPLFRPNGAGSLGISKLLYVRALTTTSAGLNVTWTGGGPNGGTLELKSKHEGLTGNGYEVNAISAYQSVEILTPGIQGDKLTITVNNVDLGDYTFLGSETATQTATAYASVINGGTGTHGYTATAAGTFITIIAPAGTGASANSYLVEDNTGMVEVILGGATMTGGVTEIRATNIFDITNAGASGDAIIIDAGATTLGSYISIGGTISQAATALVVDINANTTGGTAHGYTATNVNSLVTLYAPVGQGATANGIIVTPTLSGTAAITPATNTFAGGVTGAQSSQTMEMIDIGTTGNVLDLKINNITVGSYTIIGTETPTSLATTFNGIINAGTGTHTYTSTVIGTVLTIQAPLVAGSTPNTYAFISSGQSGALTLTLGGATMTGGLNGSELTRGLCMTMEAGVVDPTKFKVKFFRGTFTGLDSDNQAYNGVSELLSLPDLIAESPEFDNIVDLIAWANINADLNNSIKLVNSTVVGTGQITSVDLLATVGNQLFSGGTQIYNTARVTEILQAVRTADYTHILSMDDGMNYSSADNGRLQYHIASEAKYDKFMWVAGGFNKDEWNISIAAAEFFNYQRIQVVHGGCEVPSQQTGIGLKQKSALYKTAHVLGRTCGLAPQTPVTFKGLGYSGEVHSLAQNEITEGIKKGVLLTVFDGELGFHVVQYGINTLQRNQFLVNEDSTSYLLSMNRISAQLNKELEVNSKIQLLGNQTQGPNIGTLTAEVVRNWVAKYLKKKTATTTTDNLIISYQDIVVAQQGDAYQIGYSFKANVEISKLFITGTILDPNS